MGCVGPVLPGGKADGFQHMVEATRTTPLQMEIPTGIKLTIYWFQKDIEMEFLVLGRHAFVFDLRKHFPTSQT